MASRRDGEAGGRGHRLRESMLIYEIYAPRRKERPDVRQRPKYRPTVRRSPTYNYMPCPDAIYLSLADQAFALR